MINKKIKLVREDSGGNMSVLDVNAAEVSRDGLRAVDSGFFTIPSTHTVTNGDVIKYIQDVADTRYLRGAYLFQGSCLDESGYNVDPINQTHYGIPAWNDYDGLNYEQNVTTNSKFEGFYQAIVNAGANGAILENKTLPNGDPVHDFSGDFDIFAWVTAPASGSGFKCIYSKTSSTSMNGSGAGFRMAIDKTSGGTTWRLSVYMQNNSGGSLKSVTTGYKIALGGTCCIRVRRSGSLVEVWLVKGDESAPFGTPDGTITNATGNFNTTKQAIIGTHPSAFTGDLPTATTSRFEGKLHSLRVYCGGILDDLSANQVYSSRPIPLIMKLAGNVWKIENNLDKKKIQVKGFGKVITDTLVTSELLTAGTATGEFYQSGSRNLTLFTNATPLEIIRAIFAKLNSTLTGTNTFNLSLRDLSGYANIINTYNAEGNFLELINQLMLAVASATNLSFYVSPRGKCIIESKDINMTHLKFSNGKYQITADGFDDSNTVNDLYVSTRAGGSFGTLHSRDTTSVNSVGLYSKRILAPQLTDATAAILFRDKFLSTYKDINRRYTIVAPFLIDFIRENFKIRVINDIKNLDANSSIKSITWVYPDNRTTIETGDYLLDAFDLERLSSDTINNLFTDTKLNP